MIDITNEKDILINYLINCNYLYDTYFYYDYLIGNNWNKIFYENNYIRFYNYDGTYFTFSQEISFMDFKNYILKYKIKKLLKNERKV